MAACGSSIGRRRPCCVATRCIAWQRERLVHRSARLRRRAAVGRLRARRDGITGAAPSAPEPPCGGAFASSADALGVAALLAAVYAYSRQGACGSSTDRVLTAALLPECSRRRSGRLARDAQLQDFPRTLGPLNVRVTSLARRVAFHCRASAARSVGRAGASTRFTRCAAAACASAKPRVSTRWCPAAHPFRAAVRYLAAAMPRGDGRTSDRRTSASSKPRSAWAMYQT